MTKPEMGPVEFRGARVQAPNLWRALLPFEFIEPSRTWVAQPQLPFRPRGLAVWGAPPLATVECHIGTSLQMVAAWGRVPAKFFAYGSNYEQIAKMLDAGQEPPAWVDFKASEPGILLQLEVLDDNGIGLGPKNGIELVMWGEAIRD